MAANYTHCRKHGEPVLPFTRAMICDLRWKGLDHDAIGARLGLTRQRVRDVVRSHFIDKRKWIRAGQEKV